MLTGFQNSLTVILSTSHHLSLDIQTQLKCVANIVVTTAGIPRRRHQHRHPRDDPREDVGEDVGVGVRVGVVECQLIRTRGIFFTRSD